MLSLIAQLEPSNPPTTAQLSNADALLTGGTNPTCNNVGPLAAPTGTSPSITPLCWTDAQGVNTFSGPNAEATTGPTTLMNLGASFDTALGNIWGQTEAKEARELMVTGLFGPQTDLDRLPNWGRNLTTTGEDPRLSNQMVSSQINGIQGAGAMSQMKHFAVYNGQKAEHEHSNRRPGPARAVPDAVRGRICERTRRRHDVLIPAMAGHRHHATELRLDARSSESLQLRALLEDVATR